MHANGVRLICHSVLFLFYVIVCSPGLVGSAPATNSPRFGPPTGSVAPEYIFGVHPLHNPQRLFEIYGPLVDYLNSRMNPGKLKLEASRTFEDYDQKLYSGHFHFALPNPQETVFCRKHGYRVFGKLGRDEPMHGVIVIRKDSGIHRVSDLKGKTVCFPAPTAMAAAIMPQYYLHTHGLDVNRDITIRYVGSQESSLLNVYLKQADAGATWTMPWRMFNRDYPVQARELTAQWLTEPVAPSGLVVHESVPPEVSDEISTLLFGMHTTSEGRMVLDKIPVSRFEPADNAFYDPLAQFLKRFSETVRPILP